MRRLAPGLTRRFGADFAKVGMYPIPILTRDIPGYKIPPHPDTRWKGITVQLYLPRDDGLAHIGTIFHERLARRQPAEAGANEILARIPAMPSRSGTIPGIRPIRSDRRSRRGIRSCSPISSMPGRCGSCAIAASESAISWATRFGTRRDSQPCEAGRGGPESVRGLRRIKAVLTSPRHGRGMVTRKRFRAVLPRARALHHCRAGDRLFRRQRLLPATTGFGRSKTSTSRSRSSAANSRTCKSRARQLGAPRRCS